MDLNVWTGEGFVGNDPKITYVGEKQTPKINFVIANHRGFNSKETVNWVPCIVWGDRAENLMRYLTKGTRVAVTGELELRSWQDDSGAWQKATSINCREVNFISGTKPKAEGEEPAKPSEPVAAEEASVDKELD